MQRAQLSGYGVVSIIHTDIRMPNGITIDQTAHKLYWTDARFDKIERANLDGTGREVRAAERQERGGRERSWCGVDLEC